MSDPNDNNTNTDQPPTLIQEHSHHQDSTDTTTTVDPSTLPKTKDFNPRCPFCIISVTYPPIDPLDATTPSLSSSLSPTKLEPPSFILLTTPHAIAFLDIMPLTRGHVLVAPRHHRVKLGDMSPTESAELGRLLPIVARGVLRAVLPDIPHDQADYNIVQNNGPGAAQVVPHVHFHVVPRPPFGYVYPEQGKGKGKKYPPNKQPEPKLRNAILFGRGMREDLDWDEAEILVEDMRRMVAEEWKRVGGVVIEGEGKAEERGKDARKQQKQRGDWKV